MSLPTGDLPSIPEETVRVAQAAFPKGNVYMKMRDNMGPIFTNEDFADLYPRVGQHGVPPWRLALVTIMQFAEDLSDRAAADAVRGRIDWKYMLGLELDDPGFHYSVLSEFRTRLLGGEAERRLLEKLLETCKAQGVLKTDGKQRTDATHILGALRLLNRIELVHETLRHTLNTLANLVPDWLTSQVTAEWFDQYGKRLTEYELPEDKSERQAIALQIGADGIHLLHSIYEDSSVDWLRYVPAVETLRQVWVQAYYHMHGQLHWREKKDLPPGSKKVMSPHDEQACVSKKRDVTWVGYKVHLTETCNPDTPNLIIQVETTPSTTHDSPTFKQIRDDLAAHDRLPSEHMVDGGYMSVDALIESRVDQVDLIGPLPPDSSWQARDPDAFDQSRFTILWAESRVICPQGHSSQSWFSLHDPRGYDTIRVKFRASDCAECSQRPQCTRSTTDGRTLTLAIQERYETLIEGRERQQTDEFKELYAVRAGVEGTISQAASALGLRQARYRGLDKTHLQSIATAAAINLRRIAHWFSEVPRSTTRTSAFAKLAA